MLYRFKNQYRPNTSTHQQTEIFQLWFNFNFKKYSSIHLHLFTNFKCIPILCVFMVGKISFCVFINSPSSTPNTIGRQVFLTKHSFATAIHSQNTEIPGIFLNCLGTSAAQYCTLESSRAWCRQHQMKTTSYEITDVMLLVPSRWSPIQVSFQTDEKQSQ